MIICIKKIWINVGGFTEWIEAGTGGPDMANCNNIMPISKQEILVACTYKCYLIISASFTYSTSLALALPFTSYCIHLLVLINILSIIINVIMFWLSMPTFFPFLFILQEIHCCVWFLPKCELLGLALIRLFLMSF